MIGSQVQITARIVGSTVTLLSVLTVLTGALKATVSVCLGWGLKAAELVIITEILSPNWHKRNRRRFGSCSLQALPVEHRWIC
jgi:hypothetical protein